MDKITVEKVAKLARLELTELEKEKFSEQLGRALNYFEQISKISTTGVEPLVTPNETENFWRQDKIESSQSVEELVANAPERSGNLFKVPPVV